MTIKVFIENTRIVANGTLILGDNQTARIEVSRPPNVPLPIEIVRLDLTWSKRDQSETDVKFRTAEDGVVKFDFLGWKGTGTGLRKPLMFGHHHDNPLYLGDRAGPLISRLLTG